jgi:glycosyltransferase involved in cell wall biosynthesis
MREGKGIYELVQACSRLDKDAFNLRMIGNVSEPVRRRLIHLAGPGWERWLKVEGELPRQACQRELLRSDALVLPSTGEFEAFPYVVLEAMSVARPVVVTARGAVPEIVAANSEYPCGLVVPPGDVGALAGALQAVIDRPEDSALLGINGFSRARSVYEVGRVVDELCRVWFVP